MRRQHETKTVLRETRQKKRQRRLQRKVIGFCIFTFLLGLLCGKLVFARENAAERETKKITVRATEGETDTGAGKEIERTGGDTWENTEDTMDDWKLGLVNRTHFMEEGYKPMLAEIENGYYFDARAVEYLQEMLADGKKEGLDFWICSAYRTNEKQTTLFENKVSRLMAEGMSYEEAYEEAGTVVAYPGTSEHQLGLAVDIVAKDYQHLDEWQAQTDEAKWLAKNCWKYGFILRYPLDKTEETGIIFEPWHYRYVGEEAAKEIMEQGICLEEYLETM